MRIHSGNTAADTDGCILLGQVRANLDDVGGSHDAYNSFFAKLQAAINCGEPVFITVAPAQPSGRDRPFLRVARWPARFGVRSISNGVWIGKRSSRDSSTHSKVASGCRARRGVFIVADVACRMGTTLPSATVHLASRRSAPTGANNPELETMTRAAAIQARPDQVGYFHSALASTDAALQQSRELQALGSAAGSTATVNAKSLQLRDALDEVEHDDGIFMASFSKTQSTELKPLVKRLRKSYTFVSKEYKAVQQRMEPGKVVPERLTSAAANLEKALSDFRTDQVRLAREMGVQSK